MTAKKITIENLLSACERTEVEYDPADWDMTDEGIIRRLDLSREKTELSGIPNTKSANAVLTK